MIFNLLWIYQNDLSGLTFISNEYETYKHCRSNQLKKTKTTRTSAQIDVPQSPHYTQPAIPKATVSMCMYASSSEQETERAVSQTLKLLDQELGKGNEWPRKLGMYEVNVWLMNTRNSLLLL